MCETNAMFRPTSIDHDHVFVAFDLTQILAGESGYRWEGGRQLVSLMIMIHSGPCCLM